MSERWPSTIRNCGPAMAIRRDIVQLAGFSTYLDWRRKAQAGRVLRMIAAMKSEGELLEIGTGFGYSTAWMASGMDARSRLTSLDVSESYQKVAVRHLGPDRRISFVVENALTFLERSVRNFDVIFADAEVGKFERLDLALSRLKPGGIYVADDMTPLRYWTVERHGQVSELMERLLGRTDLTTSAIDWATGLVIAVRKSL